jgi:hypothetical protein
MDDGTWLKGTESRQITKPVKARAKALASELCGSAQMHRRHACVELKPQEMPGPLTC